MTVASEIEAAARVYDPRSQISVFQMRIIAGVVAQHGFAARFLVHGCGFDSRFWKTLNGRGRTLFVEEDAAWVGAARELDPSLDVAAYPELPTTVEQTLRGVDLEALGGAETPDWAREPWDIVLIDGPKGYRPDQAGRALPIFWASQALQTKADIFVDDYDRPLERLYCDTLLRADDRLSVTLPGAQRKQMFWRMGELSLAMR